MTGGDEKGAGADRWWSCSLTENTGMHSSAPGSLDRYFPSSWDGMKGLDCSLMMFNNIRDNTLEEAMPLQFQHILAVLIYTYWNLPHPTDSVYLITLREKLGKLLKTWAN